MAYAPFFGIGLDHPILEITPVVHQPASGAPEDGTAQRSPRIRMSAVRQKRPRFKPGRESYRALRRKVLERDGWRCLQCGRTTELQVHHIRFRSALGDDDPENLITRCSQCHARAHRWKS